MLTEVFVDPAGAIVVSMFSLAWFIVGLSAGRRLSPSAGSRSGPASAAGKKKGDRTELYVGNLPYDLRSKDLRRTFEEHGKVESVRIIENKFTGKSKGFAFIEMAGRPDAYAAIKALNGKEISGRKLVVNEAKTRVKE